MAISGYADLASVRPGGTLTLFVSTDAPRFRAELYRVGAVRGPPLPMTPDRDVRAGVQRPPGGPNADWGWQPFTYAIPPGWASGIYVCFLVECDAAGADLPVQALDRRTYDGPDRKVMFVVRAPAGHERRIVFKVPTATYAAYNYTGGGSCYADAGGFTVSLRRPGIGTGGVTTYARAGTPYPQVDWYDPSSDRATLVHLEAPFIAWLEKCGYAFDYCNDFDFEADAAVLAPYHLMLSVGHDEYWSERLREQVNAMLHRGGNVAFLSGNTCYKFVTYPTPWQLTNRGTWPKAGRASEEQLTGVSYVHGGGRWESTGMWDGPRQAVGYELQFQDHWALKNVASPLGDVYPDTGEPSGCIGYECDGAKATKQNGVWTPQGTPGDFFILGQATLDGSWQDDLDHSRACTIGLYTSPGIAFAVGSVDWVRVASSGRDPNVANLTRNVIDALSVAEPGWSPLGGQITSAPLPVRHADGKLEVFGRGYDGAARRCAQLAPGGGWTGWTGVGGALAGNGRVPSRLAWARGSEGRPVIAARFADGSVEVLSPSAPGGAWGAWVSLSGRVGSDPAMAASADGRVSAFVRGYDGLVYVQQQAAPGAAFGGWAPLQANSADRIGGNLDVAPNADGRLQLFARGGDHALWTFAQASPSDLHGNWTSLGGSFASDPAVGINADGRLEVFARGVSGKLYHAWQKSPGGAFSTFADRGGLLAGNPAVARNADGRLEAFARGTDGAIWHVSQVAPNGTWGPWSSLGGAFAGDPAVVAGEGGRLDVFATSPARSVWHRAQRTPGSW
ncbi:MAG TPA: N,N-dimethylformamidase beta subunit family domain-containing protein [Myxococcaceae bacterium]|nr:N,N-dimethylformamidase beta subunit family domain-containing protein [Myxococcaceae bacterium]